MKHILRDEHDDLGNDLPGGPVAWRVGSQVFQQEHLAKLHSGGVRKPVEPLHLHANPAEVGEIKKHNAELLGEVDTLTAEVERLRDQLKSLEIELKAVTDEHDESLRQLTEMTTERDRLREGLDNANINIANWAKANQSLKAQLVERDALLIKANYVIDHARTIDKQAFAYGSQNVDHGLFRGLGNLLAQYDEALSASAEPRKEDH